MLRLCSRPLERCFGSIRNDVLLWHTDLKQHASGDFSIAVAQANSSLEDRTQVFTSPSATYIGVYDGHGGPEASRFINTHLFGHLHKLASEQGGLSTDVIKKAFGNTEDEFLRIVSGNTDVIKKDDVWMCSDPMVQMEYSVKHQSADSAQLRQY